MPCVSVCVPVYNGRRYVLETIASVRAQTFTDWELVITENGSSDGSPQLIEEALRREKDPRIRYQAYPSATGLPADWNRALALSTGEFVKVLPCDDRLHPECLALQVQALSADREIGFVSSSRRVIDAAGRTRLPSLARRARRLGAIEGRRALLGGGHNCIGEPACGLIRRTLLEALGGFDAQFRYYPDLDFWCRALISHPALQLPQALCDFRVHANTQSTALRSSYIDEYARLLEHHAAAFGLSRFDEGRAMVRAQVIARARGAFIRWVVASEVSVQDGLARGGK